MAVHLTVENETSLPDGGPLTYSISGKRGIDIGRDAYLDWCLPDPTRTVSGKHCEIRYRDGGYWLHDVSRNGTFLNRNSNRMQEPHRLRDGDRIEVGRYIIAVRVEGDEAIPEPGGAFTAAPSGPSEYWNAASDAAPPISPRDLRPARETQPVQADFREWAIDVPPPMQSAPGGYDAFTAPPPPASPPRFEDMAWAQGAAAAPAAEPYVPPVPSPRRPSAPASGASPWDATEIPSGPPAGWPSAPPPPAPAADAPGWDAAPFAPPPPAPAWPAPAPPPPAAAPISEPPVARQQPSPATPASGPPPAAEWGAPPPAAPAENPWGKPSLGSERTSPPPPTAPDPVDRSVVQAAPTPPETAAAPGARPGGDFVARFAKGAGVSPEVLAWRDPGDLAEELGVLMRLAAENVKQLLSARAETKRVARAGGHTMIQALDNNPLKFSPTVNDALKIMLGRPSGGYLDARRALEQSFKDLKVHQVKSYSAMQHAIRLLMEDLDPAAIEESMGGDRGLGSILGSKKAKLWDLYATRWDTLTSPHEDGMVDAFMMFFAECYDRGGEKG